MSRDMMGAFELYQPDSVDGAVALLEQALLHEHEAHAGRARAATTASIGSRTA